MQNLKCLQFAGMQSTLNGLSKDWVDSMLAYNLKQHDSLWYVWCKFPSVSTLWTPSQNFPEAHLECGKVSILGFFFGGNKDR